jgi:hypothetical protein
LFAIQLGESTDITPRSNKLTRHSWCCWHLFQFSWFVMEIISICMDGAPSVAGNLKWFVALAKQKIREIVFTHCFLHRKAFISKSVVPEAHKVLDDIRIVNYINSGHYKWSGFSNVLHHWRYSHNFSWTQKWGGCLEGRCSQGSMNWGKSLYIFHIWRVWAG